MIFTNRFSRVRLATPFPTIPGASKSVGIREWLKRSLPDIEDRINTAHGLLESSLGDLQEGGSFPATKVRKAVSRIKQVSDWIRKGKYKGYGKGGHYEDSLREVHRELVKVQPYLEGLENYWDRYGQDPAYIFLQNCVYQLDAVLNHPLFTMSLDSRGGGA